MIKLPSLSTNLENEFSNDIVGRYKELLENYLQLDDPKIEIKNYFAPNGELKDEIIKGLILGKKSALLNAVKEIGPFDKKSEKDNELSEKFIGLYENFTKRKLGKTLAKKMGISVCPYCNRSYVFTLSSEGIRPQYDHFFCKSKYPYLAVSLYNLIPSCPICNLSKLDEDVYDTNIGVNILYPHEDEFGYDVQFKTIGIGNITYVNGNSNDDFQIKINCPDMPLERKKRVENANGLFSLEKLYEKHKDYVRDIMRLAYMYNEDFIDDLFSKFPHLFKSREEIESTIFLTPLPYEDWGKRVLAKLSYDIITDVRHNN